MNENLRGVVKGKKFTTEALVIVALMRKLGQTRIEVEELDLREPKGLILDKFYIEMQE